MSNQNTATPDLFVREVERLLGIKFKYDLAASSENAKAKNFFTEADDSLTMDWPRDEWCWLNPPFAKLTKWINKCAIESFEGSKIVTIWPLSGDRNQRYVWENCQICIIEGRIWPLVRGCMLCVWDASRGSSIQGFHWDKKNLTFIW